ncbi:MAG: hypothetical protein LIO85_01995 [Rikenellaceae bacterium]|nr:hypothetical protein [Rikenellaceae bacterium]
MKKTILLACLLAAAIFTASAQHEVVNRNLTGTKFKDAHSELGLHETTGYYDRGLYPTLYQVPGQPNSTKIMLVQKDDDGTHTVVHDMDIDRTPDDHYTYGSLQDRNNSDRNFEGFYRYRMDGDQKKVVEMYDIDHSGKQFIKKPVPEGSHYQDYQP